jgi:hypothetical protein
MTMDRQPSLVIVCVDRPPRSGLLTAKPSLTVAIAPLIPLTAPFAGHSGGRLATVLADPARRAKDQQIGPPG